MHFSTALVAALVSSAAAIPSSVHVLHEKRGSLSNDWSRSGLAPADAVLPMRIALKQPNLDRIPQLLEDVANPKSKNYGKHWTGEELAQKFAPSDATVKAVKSWLNAAGFKVKVAANKGWVEFNSTVGQAEELLQTKYHVYERHGGRDGRQHVGCDGYSLPGQITKHVDFITPTITMNELKRGTGASLRRRQDIADEGVSGRRTMFTAVSDEVAQNLHTGFDMVKSAMDQFMSDSMAKATTMMEGSNESESPGPAPNDTTTTNPPSLAICAQGVTPACMRAMYGIPKGNTSTMGNPLGLYESMDYYDQEDLDIFFSQFAPDIDNGTAPMLDSINGGLGPAQTGVSGESVLDLEVIYPLIHPQGVRLLQVDDPTYSKGTKRGHFDSLLDALDASFCSFQGGDNSTVDPSYPNPVAGGYNGTKMCGTYDPPTVLSISYGYQETYFSPAYLQRQCLEFGKLGMAGTTVVVSSGDSGVSASFCANPKIRTATPQFPASCPYVTTVGATMLNTNVTDLNDPQAEVAAHKGGDYQTGGGFSNIFDMPGYQQSTVAAYLEQYSAQYGNATMVKDVMYNSSGRAYPDVAAIGTNITTITNGKVFVADGTSASAPLFASLITLVNEIRLGSGKGPVGFLNPTLYGSQGVFKDVTSGNNGGCGMPGFQAMKGWDPVTGLGTPQWDQLQELLVSV